MEKRLKKYTSIPQHLYVNRSADEQLKRIVNEMQRPGYVLVARQMGKTNLLFNAKRTLEGDNRLFIYVDLSNIFEFERDCYRNIINAVIEPNEELFKQIESKIEVLRNEKHPPHSEYSKSLRIILNHYPGDVVIILDEIDALRSAEYSDNIFAQIRSNYFSRTNFPVLERLTYILSGVIEPTELIKDRNKSPFNIGDKIYLDDFSLDEHNLFIQKSKLQISKEVSDKIFYWTKGNPRLTFDICSTIEDKILENQVIDTDSLEDIITKKYLTTFDIAPIDHIRELVISNKKARKAIQQIQQNKETTLSDKIKKELYLFGIIDSNFNEKTTIKNPIIEHSLNEDWINSVDKLTKDKFELGLEKIGLEEYKEAISLLSDFISESEPTKIKLEISNYNLGYAYFKLKNYDEAIRYFSKNYLENSYKNNAKSFLGLSKLSIGEESEGKKLLEEIISYNTKDFAFRNAVLNLAPLISAENQEKAQGLYDKLFDSTFEPEDHDDLVDGELDQIRTLAKYYKYEISISTEDKNSAEKYLDEAIQYASASDKLHLKYLKYDLLDISDKNLKSEFIDSIIKQNLLFDDNYSYGISFSAKNLYIYLSWCFIPDEPHLFEKLLNYSYTTLFNEKINKFQIIYNAIEFSNQTEDILKYILKRGKEVPKEVLLKVYKDLAYITPVANVACYEYFDKYKSIFIDSDNLDTIDIYLFAKVIKGYSDRNKIDDALDIFHSIESRLIDIEDQSLKFESLIIYYWGAHLYFTKRLSEKAVEYSEKTISEIKESKQKNSSMIDEKGLKSIIDQMEQIKLASTIQKPIVRKNKYGRNDLVKVKYVVNGQIATKKYKKLEADIIAERCVIID